MKYDFTTVYDRRGMDALAVDALGQPGGFAPGKPKDGFSVIPMWVADMNFATVPTIPAAIIERAQHPLYGYFATPDAYHQAITDWQRDRNGVTDLPKEAIGYENGVLGGVISALGCLAAPGDAVLARSEKPHYNEMNVLSMHALLGAYTPEGREWVDELCEVLSGNVNFACDFITRHFPGVQVAKPEGTYMLFLDCTDWCAAHEKTLEDVLHAGWDVGVAWQDGRMFHHPCAIRMNLALPRALVEEAFNRLSAYVFV